MVRFFADRKSHAVFFKLAEQKVFFQFGEVIFSVGERLHYYYLGVNYENKLITRRNWILFVVKLFCFKRILFEIQQNY